MAANLVVSPELRSIAIARGHMTAFVECVIMLEDRIADRLIRMAAQGLDIDEGVARNACREETIGYSTVIEDQYLIQSVSTEEYGGDIRAVFSVVDLGLNYARSKRDELSGSLNVKTTLTMTYNLSPEEFVSVIAAARKQDLQLADVLEAWKQSRPLPTISTPSDTPPE